MLMKKKNFREEERPLFIVFGVGGVLDTSSWSSRGLDNGELISAVFIVQSPRCQLNRYFPTLYFVFDLVRILDLIGSLPPRCLTLTIGE